MNYFIIALLINLMFVFYQDFKYRQIHVLLPVLIFCFSYLIFRKEGYMFFFSIFYNIGFFLLTFMLLVVYISIKNKTLINPFKNYFGFGDLLFFLSVTPLFFIHNYIIYFIFSMVFSAIIYLVLEKYLKVKSVPLAGLSALFLVLVILKDISMNLIKITIIG